MKFALAQNKKELEKYKVKASDRAYQFWERNSLGIDVWSRPLFIGKLKIRCTIIQYSSIGNFANIGKNINIRHQGFYEKGVDEFRFLTHDLG